MKIKGMWQRWAWMSGLFIVIMHFCIGQVVLADSSILPMPAKEVLNKTMQTRQVVSTAGQFNKYPDSVVAVAGTVNLTQDTPSNAVVLAGQANIGGRVNRYIVASAGKVNFNATADKSAILFGGNINSSPDSVMHQGGFVIGGDVNLTGNVGSDITVIGGKVNLGGKFAGNVDVIAGQLTVSPNTKIHGKLNYVTAGQANISGRATINGGAHAVDPGVLASTQQVTPTIQTTLLHSAFQLVQLLVVLMVLSAVCRTTAYRVASSFQARPLSCFGYGVLVIIVGFLAVPILVATVIGSYLALIWGLMYTVLILLGYLYFAQSIGLLLMGRIKKGQADTATPGYWKTVLAGLIGLIFIVLLGMIPMAGTWLVFASVLFGVGALVRTSTQCCKTSTA